MVLICISLLRRLVTSFSISSWICIVISYAPLFFIIFCSLKSFCCLALIKTDNFLLENNEVYICKKMLLVRKVDSYERVETNRL